SVHALLTQAASRNPTGEALVCQGERLTWTEVLERSGQVAAGLARRGVQAADRVALLVGNRLKFVLAVFGAARLGAISVPLGIRQQTPEIAYALNDCGARLLICEADLVERLPPAAEVPSLQHRVVVAGREGGEGFDALLGDPSDLAADPASVGEEDTAFILYTSGTTGRPKGAMLTHLNVVHSAMVYEHCMGLSERDRSIVTVPLAHVTGLVAGVAALARCVGTLIILPAFKAADFLRLAAQERMTHTILVPAMYNLCLLQPDFESYDLATWRLGGYGGAPMPPSTIARLAEKLPGLLLMNAYGATETTSPTTLMPPAYTATRADSVGKPVPGATVIVVDDAGRELPRGEAGEIWIHGPSVVKGYWNNPAATAETFTGGFWHSGDIGTIDEEGFVRVLDRKKDMINRGGHKIYTTEVESVLVGHPDVVECAVVAIPCPVLGERVHAFVVPRDVGIRVDAMRAYCAERLSDYKVPESFTLRSDPLPRNANGKVIKRALRDELDSSSLSSPHQPICPDPPPRTGQPPT
ncbi:MAG: acyl--CoA ligase, partial [Pseudomonadota bacterium]|nr:acyl--CoA ligase [Pseudomonadota bacterium]